MMAYQPHPPGMQPPGMAPGQPMAPGQSPGPQMGQPPGQGMPPQMHPGMAGPNMAHTQGQPVMGGMPPGMGPGGPNAHALQHLQPGGHAVFQNPQMAQAFQGQMNPTMMQNQQLMRQRQIMQAQQQQQQQQGMQGGPGGPMMGGMQYGGMSPAQLQALQNNPAMRQHVNLPPHLQNQLAANQEQSRQQAQAQARQHQQQQQIAAHQMALQNSQASNHGQPGHPGQQGQQGQPNQQAPQMKPQASMQGSTDSQTGPSPPQQQQQQGQQQAQGQAPQQQQGQTQAQQQQQRAQNQTQNQQEGQQQQPQQQTPRQGKQTAAQQAQAQAQANQQNQQNQQNNQQQNQPQQGQPPQQGQQGQDQQPEQAVQHQQAAQLQQQMRDLEQQRQMQQRGQMQMGQNPAMAMAWQRQQQNAMQNMAASNASPTAGTSRLLQFTERLSRFTPNRQPQEKPQEILMWQAFVQEFFSDDGLLRTQFHDPADNQMKEVEICVPALARYFWTQYNSGVEKIHIFISEPSEFIFPNSYRYVECQKATLSYWYENGAQIVCRGTLKAFISQENKLEELEIVSSNHEEYLPRSQIEDLFPAESPVKDSPKQSKTPAKAKKQQNNRTIKFTDLPKSPIHRVGVNKAVNQFFEIAHTLSLMRNLLEFAQHNNHLSPQDALDRLVEANSQGQANFHRFPMQPNAQQPQINVPQHPGYPQQQFSQGMRTPSMNGPPGQPPFASPAHTNLALPNQNTSNTSSPHMRPGGGPGGHTPSPRQPPHMIAQHSQQSGSGNASGAASSSASPNVTNKRRRSTAKGDAGDDSGGPEVNGNVGGDGQTQAKVKQSPRPGAKRQKSGLA